jgi:hypothetical protein
MPVAIASMMDACLGSSAMRHRWRQSSGSVDLDHAVPVRLEMAVKPDLSCTVEVGAATTVLETNTLLSQRTETTRKRLRICLGTLSAAGRAVQDANSFGKRHKFSQGLDLHFQTHLTNCKAPPSNG